MMNPSIEELKVQKHNGRLALSWENPMWVANGVRVAFPLRHTTGCAYLSLSLKDNEFLQYLQEVDTFMSDWTDRYNDKYQTSYTYQPLVKSPMQYDDDGNLMLNEEALEKYGPHVDTRLTCQRSRARVTVETQDGEVLTCPGIFDVEGYMHQGAIVSVSMTPSLHQTDEFIRVIPKVTQVLIVESEHGLLNGLLKKVKPVKKIEEIEL